MLGETFTLKAPVSVEGGHNTDLFGGGSGGLPFSFPSLHYLPSLANTWEGRPQGGCHTPCAPQTRLPPFIHLVRRFRQGRAGRGMPCPLPATCHCTPALFLPTPALYTPHTTPSATPAFTPHYTCTPLLPKSTSHLPPFPLFSGGGDLQLTNIHMHEMVGVFYFLTGDRR